MLYQILSNISNTPDDVKCISFNNQQCMNKLTLINLHPNQYIERSHYYLFAVTLDERMNRNLLHS